MFKKISLVLTMVLALTGSSFAATYYVAAGSAGAGTAWSDAFGNLDAALAVAISGDTVQVAAGNYVPSGATFTVPAGVTVKGGWTNYVTSYGNVTNIGELYNPKTYQTVLSGDTNGDDLFANLYADDGALDAMPSRADNKAAIMTLSGNATVDGFYFVNGGTVPSANTAGGIVCGAGAAVTIQNCEFMGCVGSTAGAISASSATLTLTNCYFTGNVSYQASCTRGTGTQTITKCTLKGNSNTGENAGGFRWDTSAGATFTMTDCVVLDSVSGLVSAFGSLYLRGGNSCTMNISKCVFLNDEADGASTFLYNSGSSAVQTYNFTNCLWAGCEGGTSNGVFLIRPRYAGGTTTVNLTNCTVADNKDTGNYGIKAYAGSGLANTSFVLNIKNSILWGNSGAQVLWDTTSLSFTDTTYNPFKISYSCIDTVDPNNYPAINPISGIPTGLVVANPQFVGGGDYHLQSTSPCIDKGDPASSYANEPKWLNGCRVNMGAYGNTKEAATTTTCVALTADTNGDCRVNNADLLTLRGQWLKTCP